MGIWLKLSVTIWYFGILYLIGFSEVNNSSFLNRKYPGPTMKPTQRATERLVWLEAYKVPTLHVCAWTLVVCSHLKFALCLFNCDGNKRKSTVCLLNSKNLFLSVSLWVFVCVWQWKVDFPCLIVSCSTRWGASVQVLILLILPSGFMLSSGGSCLGTTLLQSEKFYYKNRTSRAHVSFYSHEKLMLQ